MIILGVETSCDDTGIAIIEDVPARPAARGQRGEAGIPQFKILSSVVSSQVELHKKYGGVYPSLAKREHQRNLVPVLEQALKGGKLLCKSKCQSSNVKSNPKLKFQKLKKILIREPDLLKETLKFLKKYQKPKFDPHTKFGVGIDLIAITNGPGLEPCLWVGVNFAKALAYFWDLPIVPVNHIEEHILANWLSPIGNIKCPMSNVKSMFPAVCLVVSGGHTQLILMKNFGKYQIIGETRDDAAGECFDKTARILGLGYPGGPAISAAAEMAGISNIPARLASQGEAGGQYPRLPSASPQANGGQAISNINLPRPMIHQKNYDFSFSGLKTAVLYDFKKRPEKIRKSTEYIQEMAKEIQQAIIDVLIKKTIKAAKDFKVKSVILGGGVTANKELRNQFGEKIKKDLPNIQYLIPNIQLATDNAAMTAVTGYFHKPEKLENIEAEANLRLK